MTPQQRKALHLWFELMSDDLSGAGYSVQQVCTLPIAWTKGNFKENIFKPVMKAMYPDKVSTEELNTTELTAVYEQVNQIISEKWGVGHQFPDYISQAEENKVK